MRSLIALVILLVIVFCVGIVGFVSQSYGQTPEEFLSHKVSLEKRECRVSTTGMEGECEFLEDDHYIYLTFRGENGIVRLIRRAIKMENHTYGMYETIYTNFGVYIDLSAGAI